MNSQVPTFAGLLNNHSNSRAEQETNSREILPSDIHTSGMENESQHLKKLKEYRDDSSPDQSAGGI